MIMKRLVVALFAVVSVLSLWAGDMVSSGRHSLYAGVEGAFSFNHTDISRPTGLYRLVGGFVSYSCRMGDFYVNPELSLYYQYNPNMDFIKPGSSSKPDGYGDCFGGALGVYLGRNLGYGLSLFSGPLGKCNFYQRSYGYNGSKKESSGWEGHRASLMWRFGVSYDVWRLRIRIAYDQHVTKQYDFHSLNDFAVSVAYKF